MHRVCWSTVILFQCEAIRCLFAVTDFPQRVWIELASPFSWWCSLLRPLDIHFLLLPPFEETWVLARGRGNALGKAMPPQKAGVQKSMKTSMSRALRLILNLNTWPQLFPDRSSWQLVPLQVVLKREIASILLFSKDNYWAFTLCCVQGIQ